MEESDYEYSIASELAYRHYYNNQNAEQTQHLLDTYMDGYKLDRDLSNDVGVVIERPDTSAIIAYRGTDPKNAYDVTADALIALGYNKEEGVAIPGSRFDRAEQMYKRTSEQYPHVDLTGHSLGGTLGDYIGRKYGENATVFSMGVSPVESFTSEKPKSLTRLYTTDGTDLVSLSSRFYGDEIEHKVVPLREGGLLGSHSIVNFLPPQSMLPLYGNATVIAPEHTPDIPKDTFEYVQQYVKKNHCIENPYSILCKRRNLR